MTAEKLEKQLKQLRDYAKAYNFEVNRSRFISVLDKLDDEFVKAEKIDFEKKSIEEKTLELDAELEEKYDLLIKVHDSPKSYTVSEHISKFTEICDELDEVAKKLDEKINIQQPLVEKEYLDEEVEAKLKLKSLWMQVKNMYKYEPTIHIGKIDEPSSDDELPKASYTMEELEAYDRQYKEEMRRLEQERKNTLGYKVSKVFKKR